MLLMGTELLRSKHNRRAAGDASSARASRSRVATSTIRGHPVAANPILTEPGTCNFAVSAFGCNFEVAACPEAQSVLERYVFPSLPRMAVGEGQPDIFIRIAQAAGQFRLSVNNAVVASSPEIIKLVPSLIRVLDDAVIERLKTLHAVHAGAVLWRGRVLLLPGVTHSGKSSLVAELLRHGATYFSDEYALIDREGRVHPYPRPLLLRHGRPEQVPVLAEECDAAVGRAPAPVGWILSLMYESAGAWSVAPVPQSMATLNLLQNTPHVLTDSPNMVSAFQCAVAGADCYTGRRADAVDAAGQILRLVESTS